jgi:hypothetical protein
MIEIIQRYNFHSKEFADYQHNYQLRSGDGHWKRHPEKFEQIFQLAPNVDKETMRKDIHKWIRLFDPNMLYCSEPAYGGPGPIISYKQIQAVGFNGVPAEVKDIVYSMTVGGMMYECIQYALANKHRDRSERNYHSQMIEMHAIPGRPWYNKKFAEDLYAIVPKWARYTMSDEEARDLLSLFVQRHKRLPNTLKDSWVIPHNHPLHELVRLKFWFSENPFGFTKKSKGHQPFLSQAEQELKNGKIPSNQDWLKYNHLDQWNKWMKQYPKVYEQTREYKLKNKNPSKLAKNPLKNWQNVNDLLFKTDKLTVQQYLDWSTDDKSIVGNHLKLIDAKMPWAHETVVADIQKIKNKIKKHRADIVNLYMKTNQPSNTSNLRSQVKYDYSNIKKQQLLLKLAETSVQRPEDNSLNCALASFTRKNTRFPDFNKKIRRLRPEWFDLKIIGRYQKIRYKLKHKIKLNKTEREHAQCMINNH